MQTLCGLSICSTLLLIHGPIRELQAAKNCNKIHRYPLHQWTFLLLRLYHSRFYILCPLIPITGLSSPLAPENPKNVDWEDLFPAPILQTFCQSIGVLDHSLDGPNVRQFGQHMGPSPYMCKEYTKILWLRTGLKVKIRCCGVMSQYQQIDCRDSRMRSSNKIYMKPSTKHDPAI